MEEEVEKAGHLCMEELGTLEAFELLPAFSLPLGSAKWPQGEQDGLEDVVFQEKRLPLSLGQANCVWRCSTKGSLAWKELFSLAELGLALTLSEGVVRLKGRELKCQLGSSVMTSLDLVQDSSAWRARSLVGLWGSLEVEAVEPSWVLRPLLLRAERRQVRAGREAGPPLGLV